MNVDNSQHKNRGFVLIDVIFIVILVSFLLSIAVIAQEPIRRLISNNTCKKFYQMSISHEQCNEIVSYARRGWSLKVVDSAVFVQHPVNPQEYKQFSAMPEKN